MASTSIMADLARFGPGTRGQRPVTLAGAQAYCKQLATTHYENFTVASWLLPRALRSHFYHVYAYCRWADDLADEAVSPAESLRLLDWWEAELELCYRGRSTHPVFVALAQTIEEFAIPAEPFHDLLKAFRRDQKSQPFLTYPELLDYCRNSANPVGRLVLFLGRCHSEASAILSDSICTGLQLANFWQDVARDYARGRVYLPVEDRVRSGVSDAMLATKTATPEFRQLLALEVERAQALLQAGWPLVALVPRELRIEIQLFIRGGLRILHAIGRQDYDVWTRRPTVGKLAKFNLLIQAWCAARLRPTKNVAPVIANGSNRSSLVSSVKGGVS